MDFHFFALSLNVMFCHFSILKSISGLFCNLSFHWLMDSLVFVWSLNVTFCYCSIHKPSMGLFFNLTFHSASLSYFLELENVKWSLENKSLFFTLYIYWYPPELTLNLHFPYLSPSMWPKCTDVTVKFVNNVLDLLFFHKPFLERDNHWTRII